MVNVVIGGSRNFNDYYFLEKQLDFIFLNIFKLKRRDIIIVSGRAYGADALGERYAKNHNLLTSCFEPDWETYGARAGPKRNELMISIADFVIAFWDGKSRGTLDLINKAKKKKLHTFVFIRNTDETYKTIEYKNYQKEKDNNQKTLLDYSNNRT